MNKRILWVCRSAFMVAVLVALQFITKPFGQIVTGSCVNMVLVVACLCGGFWCGAATAAISPLCAFLLGVGPKFIQLVPAIAVGNLCLVAVCALWSEFRGESGHTAVSGAAMILSSSLVKFAVLYLTAVKLVLSGLALPAEQLRVMTQMFSWPQLITALTGGSVGAYISHLIRKSVGNGRN